MKLIHMRLYPRRLAIVNEDGSMPIPFEKFKEMEKKEATDLAIVLQRSGLEIGKDFVIWATIGLYRGQGSYREMELEVLEV